MKVLVNGIGNIGTTILNLLVKYKSNFGIEEIYACKNTVQPWNRIERAFLEENGIIICTTKGSTTYPKFGDVLSLIDYVFETTSNGVGLKNKTLYSSYATLKASAQGSEKAFGKSFMSGINNGEIKDEKFVNIVSCNTHGTAALLSLVAGNNLKNLDYADVVVVRRSEDLGNHERLVSANVVARHLDSVIGTHHAIDVVDLFNSINIQCQLTSSDVTTPSQLMHAVRFNIELKEELSVTIETLISKTSFISTTKKFDSNIIFELGRRYGFQGRIFSHAVIVSENLLINKNSIKGWAFVPQEGNSIISTLHAFMLQMNLENEKELLQLIQNDLLRTEW